MRYLEANFNNMEPEKKYCLHGRVDGIACPHCMGINAEPEKKDVWAEFDFFTKDMVIGILSGDKNSPVFVNNDLEMPRLKNYIRQNFIPRAEVVEKIETMKFEEAPPFSADDTFRNQAKLINEHLMLHIKKFLLDLLTQEK